MTNKEPVADKVEEAKKLLAEEEKVKQEACAKELQEVLEKHGYTLQPVTQISLVPK